jgi:hypothetical protein
MEELLTTVLAAAFLAAIIVLFVLCFAGTIFLIGSGHWILASFCCFLALTITISAIMLAE